MRASSDVRSWGRRGFGLCALLLASSCVVTTGGEHEATPQRRIFSSNTKTTSFATLELESGFAIDPGDTIDTPQTLKFGATPTTETFLGVSPYRRVDRRLTGQRDDGEGIGDLTLGSRHRFWVGSEGQAGAAQVRVKLPTADEDDGLGTGEIDFFLAGIYSHPVDDRLLTNAFLELGVVGDPDGGADRQNALALSATYALEGRTSIFSEVAQIHHTDGPDPLFTTIGFAYALFPGTALDFGVAVGLNDDAPDAVLQFGVTTNVGHVFPPPPGH